MKSEAARLVLIAMVLAFAGALEELSPKIAGVGFPLLLPFTLIVAARWSFPMWAVTAIAAGATEDALASLPPAASATFFLAAAALVHWSAVRHPLYVLAYPAYLLWLCVWGGNLAGNLFGRILIGFPVGALSVAIVARLAGFIAREAGIDER